MKFNFCIIYKNRKFRVKKETISKSTHYFTFRGMLLIAFTVKRVPFPALSNVLCSRTENAESPIRDNYMTCVFILIGAKSHVSARAFFDRR